MATKIPNIYTILDRMDFDKQSEDMRKCIVRNHEFGLDGEALEYNTKQVAFSLIQSFYEEVILYLEEKNLNKDISEKSKKGVSKSLKK